MKKNAAKKFLRKTAALILAGVIALSMCACAEIKLVSSMDDDTLIVIDDEVCTSAEGIFRLMEVIEAYGDADEYFFERSVGSLTMEEYLKESVKEEMIKLLCVSFIADDLAIYLTDEEIEASNEAAQEAYTQISAKYDTASYSITAEDVCSLYERQALYEKVYSELTESVTMQISETDTKVIEVNFVLFPEGTTLSEAESFREKILAGADFEQTCESAGYEPYMNITVKKGDMVSAFENVAFALTEGELSECTETVDGIYLIECVEDYLEAESAANYNSVIAAAQDEIFDEAYSAVYENVQINFNSDLWKKVDAAGLYISEAI